MSDVIKYHKVVASLPGTLDANSVYYVRVGTGVDVYVSNDMGIVTAYALNPPSAGTILATELVGLDTAATPSAIVNGDTIIDALGKIQAQLNDTSPVAAATKLATARTISITGDATWTTSFDGSANVTGALTLANSGVTAGTYPKVTVDAKGRVTAGTTLVAADIPALDASKITSGTFAAARIPTLNQNTTGSAATLTTARTISITGDATWSTSFNGSANVTGALTLANSGVTAGTYPKVTVDAKGRVTAGAVLAAADIPALDASKIATGTLDASRIPTLNQNTTGSAATLSTARSISITGDATWTTSFDGSANATGELTLADSGVTAGTYPKVTVDAKGRVTAGAALVAADIPALDASKITTGVLADARLSGTYTGVNITGNAATATKLAASRTINGVAFDGTTNITINAVDATARIAASEKGAANGVATLDVNGMVPSAQLPSYVDDVLEFADQVSFPTTGETGKIYVAVDTGKIYRWTGTVYVNISANASTADAATKLATSRSISITGDATWSTSFDGSTDVTGALTLANSGVTAGTYPKVTVDAKGRVTAGTTLVAADVPALDASKITSGTFAAARIPTLNQSTTGSAATLTTARSISITGDATWTTSFNGSANVTGALTLANSGVTAGTYPKVTVDAKGRVTAGAALVAADIPALDASKITSGVFPDARLSGTYTGVNITGNAETATKLALRPINVTAADNTNRWTPVYTWTLGAQYNSFSARLWIIGRGNFDTQAEVECRAEYGVNAFGIVDLDMWSVSGVPANLEMALVTNNVAKTATLYFKSPSAWENYSIAIMNEYMSGAVRSTPALVPSTTEPTGDVVRKVSGTTYKRIYTNDYRPFADRLTTARTINGVSFDGSANIVIGADWANVTNKPATYAPSAHTHVISEVTGLQSALDGKLGSTATAAAATKLATARTIGGVSFDGTANINLPGVNTAGNQNTTGNAATATKLATARTINGVSFDGTANITVADSTKLPLTGGTLTGDLVVGATTRTANTTVRALASDGYNAGFEAYGASQGTGYTYVGQGPDYGGGIFYNGDGTPAFATGETTDTVAFYRRTANSNEVVFSYPHNSNNVTFRGVIYGNGSGLTNLALANVTGLQTELDSKVSLTGDQSVAGVKTFSTALEVTGTSKAAGRFYGGTTDPSNTTRTNYDGKLHATGFGSGRFVMEYNAATESLDFNFV